MEIIDQEKSKEQFKQILGKEKYEKLIWYDQKNEPVKEYLKKVMDKTEYEMWIDPIKETTSTKNNRTYFDVPNHFFRTKLSEILNRHEIPKELKRETWIGVLSEAITNQNVEEKTSTSIEKINQPLKAIEPENPSKPSLAMEKPYSKENVATSEIISHKFFVYPNEKKKYGITSITLSEQNFIVHRGKKTDNINEEPIGQLNTSHLKILLAIIHIWQEQGCKFFGKEAIVELSITLKEITKKIGYKKDGRTIKWLQQKVDELTKYPITLENKSNRNTTSITFLKEFTTQRKDTKNTIVLTLNPILSKQLYERQSILRNQQCYKIKNPTALKFLIAYDKRIYACKIPFRLSLEEIAKELEIKGQKKDIKEAISKVIENLNGYKLTEPSEIKIIFDKKSKGNYIIIGKREIIKNLPFS